jgi:hypothetical protein
MVIATIAATALTLPSYARLTGYASSGPWSDLIGSWLTQFVSTARGDLSLFRSVLGAAGWLTDARPGTWQPFIALGARVTFWMFLGGGVLDRLARARVTRAPAFFAACGVHVLRFLRLALIFGPLYWAALRWLPDSSWSLLVALGLISLVEDFARVRIVVEDRRSALGAAVASLRFIRRRPLRAVTLYLLSAVLTAAVLIGWSSVLSADLMEDEWRWAIGLAVVLTRSIVSLTFVASEIAFFQGELAHAEYTAAPPLVWPESPAAEAVANLSRTQQR